MIHRSLGWDVPTLLAHVSSPGSWLFSAMDYFPSQFIRAILRKLLGREAGVKDKVSKGVGGYFLPAGDTCRAVLLKLVPCLLPWTLPFSTLCSGNPVPF